MKEQSEKMQQNEEPAEQPEEYALCRPLAIDRGEQKNDEYNNQEIDDLVHVLRDWSGLKDRKSFTLSHKLLSLNGTKVVDLLASLDRDDDFTDKERLFSAACVPDGGIIARPVPSRLSQEISLDRPQRATLQVFPLNVAASEGAVHKRTRDP